MFCATPMTFQHLMCVVHRCCVSVQGTSMAFEDAAELGHCLSEFGVTTDSLRTYEDRR